MKITIMFVCALVVISHQQFQHPRDVNWLLAPYRTSQQPVVNNYQANYYNDADSDSLFHRHLRIAYLQKKQFDTDPLSKEGYEYGADNEAIDAQSRIKGSFAQQQQNGRFFFTPSFLLNPFTAKSGATITSVVTTITIQTCVPALQVSAGALTCRRKRNEIENAPENDQFRVSPSETLKLMPTALPSFDGEGGERPLSSTDGILLSSKVKSNSGEENQTSLRDKRFFFNTSASAIATAYVFIPKLITQTVNLINPAPTVQCVAPPAAGAALAVDQVACVACLPSGFIVCPV